MAGATFLGGLVLLGQTRAVVPAVALSALLLLVAVPGRTRRAWALVVPAPAWPPASGRSSTCTTRCAAAPPARGLPSSEAPRSRSCSPPWPPARSGRCAVAARRGWGTRSGGARLAWVPLAARRAVASRSAVAAAALDDPVGKVARRVPRLHASSARRADASSRFTSGGGNRYDYWRVAVDQFADNPLRGIGAGNFDRTYFLERRTTEDIRQPHSIELQTLGELGIVGGALLAVFLVAIAVGFARRAREASDDPRARGLAVAAGGTFAVWLVHTSVDWLHLIPGLTGIALCSAAVLVGPWARSRAGGMGGKAATWQSSLLCGLPVLAGAVLVGRAALADRYLNEGRERLGSIPPRRDRRRPTTRSASTTSACRPTT